MDPTTSSAEFKDAVNMSAGRLEKWLETDESKSVGQREGSGESVGSRRPLVRTCPERRPIDDGSDATAGPADHVPPADARRHGRVPRAARRHPATTGSRAATASASPAGRTRPATA
ncbi:DUF3140 domain-containing protein [Streptomyces sp. NPDC006274]|uniref:DUF3140 domain-containing protein n=1 Tax=unclassified Streptomyces TaxID=2593676 RepID=UPI0033BAC40B